MRRTAKWTKAIAAAWLFIAIAPAWQAAFPAGLWFSVQSVQIDDAREGESPKMLVDRTISRPFIGEWTVTVEGFPLTGGSVFTCSESGQLNYVPGRSLPARIDLRWWMNGARCDLPPGSYAVNTVWDIHTVYFGMKRLQVNSNVFRVLPR